MNWNTADNKHYRGPIDRVFVSDTESYEVHYYIDHYLQVHNFRVDEPNRKTVADILMRYTGRAPHKRTDLNAFLNANITRTA